MYLHIGNDISLRTDDIVSIHDWKRFMAEEGGNGAYWDELAARDKVFMAPGLLPEAVKSVVFTTGGAYLSSVTPSTLWKRCQEAHGRE